MTGALRCARLTRQVSNNHQMDEGQMNGQSGNSNNGNGSQYGSDGHQQNKRQKKSSSVDGIKDSGEMYLSAQMLVGAAAVLSALPLAASCAYDEKPESGYDKDTSSSGSVCNDLAHGIEVAEHEDEYVCVVRVRDNSPQCPGENFPTSSLSKASMRDHDRSSGQERRGSPSSGSTGSGSSGSRDTGSRSTGSSTFPVSSNETGKNSTSSETGSDDNGENGC